MSYSFGLAYFASLLSKDHRPPAFIAILHAFDRLHGAQVVLNFQQRRDQWPIFQWMCGHIKSKDSWMLARTLYRSFYKGRHLNVFKFVFQWQL